jgi:hypothetical protein
MTERAKDDGPFLSRWSERKRAARKEEAATDTSTADERAARPAAEAQAQLDASRAAAEAIDLETLNDSSDFTPFLRPGVPLTLKQAALRKLWRSNPVFAVLDGLDDHFLDFRWPEKGSEVVKTAWKVGRGFLTDSDEPAVQDQAQAETREEHAQAAEAAPPPDVAPAAPPAKGGVPGSDEPQAREPQADEPEPLKVSLARRLDFEAFAKEKD